MMHRIVGAALGVALLLPVSACGGGGGSSSGSVTSGVTTLKAGVLKVCLYPGFSPFAIKGDDGWSGWDPGNDECDVAGTGISVTEARTQQTGSAIDWTDNYYSVARSLAVRKGTKITSVEDLAGQTVVTTKGATADIDLLARIATEGLTDVKVEYVNDEAVGTRRVADGGPSGPIGFAAGVGSIDTLAASIPGIEATWIHCMMLPDGTETSEPFAFTVRSASTGVAGALNTFIAAPTSSYGGGPGSGLDCPK